MREKKKKKLFLFCFRSVFILMCDVHVGTSGKTSVVIVSKEWREINCST